MTYCPACRKPCKTELLAWEDPGPDEPINGVCRQADGEPVEVSKCCGEPVVDELEDEEE